MATITKLKAGVSQAAFEKELIAIAGEWHNAEKDEATARQKRVNGEFRFFARIADGVRLGIWAGLNDVADHVVDLYVKGSGNSLGPDARTVKKAEFNIAIKAAANAKTAEAFTASLAALEPAWEKAPENKNPKDGPRRTTLIKAAHKLGRAFLDKDAPLTAPVTKPAELRRFTNPIGKVVSENDKLVKLAKSLKVAAEKANATLDTLKAIDAIVRDFENLKPKAPARRKAA